MHLGLRVGIASADVVAVEGDVDVAKRNLGPCVLAYQRMQAGCEDRPPRVDADQRETLRAWIAFGDLVRDADQRPPHVVTLEDNLLAAQLAPSWPLWTGLKELTRASVAGARARTCALGLASNVELWTAGRHEATLEVFTD